MNRRTFVLSSCAGLLARQYALAQAVHLSDQEIRAILGRRVDVDHRATGMAVGILHGKRRRAVVHGTQDSDQARPVSADTLFEIGSVTKVFTALLLAEMVHRKELAFDDPVDRFLPAGLRTPQRNGRQITLADLATHTSGLPLFPPVAGSPLEALARYTAADLGAWLADLRLSRDPGAQWEYSNVGFGLLGLALAGRAGTTYDALLQRRLLDPLGLRDTTLHPSGGATPRLATGHDAGLVPVPPLELGLFAPAGALRSTLNDLLEFLRAVLPESGSPLERPAQSLLRIRRPAPAVGGEQALGWDVVAGPDPFVAKDGVTAGQAASIVLDPAERVAVVVLSNALPVRMKRPPDGGVGAADLARHLLRPAWPLG